ncbi:MAG: pyroglutamyl-peptidase I [Opitutae bacterium]|nr:pyroglutamyl-peptidase I [Opitutae bacterium]
MKPMLLTGFEPFGGESINPSEEIARALNGRTVAGRAVVGSLLPCVYGAAIKELKHLMKLHQPMLVVCVGQAGGRAEITPERVAINVDDARIPDNAGQQPIDKPVVKGGPAAYWSTLPIKAIVQELRKHHLAAAVSQTAGTFVCNHVFYGLMHALREHAEVRGGFIHVPYLPEQTEGPDSGIAGQPSMPLAKMVRGIELALDTAVKYRRDVRRAGGATS